ncbi:NADPH-dependent FMN reductase [Steroidobacter sp.]|uniref:NADPH-dependent FMN reductase n=1 Tax=Steroidobacter sp. TaxID=1978227 RepID=UPI001A3D9E05|nr:NAD(P)H-dependent oxidoreductase [Steroidobacter sp.]MBL8270256.1 NAD(P)H-dependent oxidoreductase [Steroidobacter sp.]
MSSLKLLTLICSTRPTRIGPSIARWFDSVASADDRFSAQLVDLVEVGLPLFDEPHHPRLRKYQHEHTKRWSALVDGADAFVFVTPEYNYSPPPSFTNAIDYLYAEWNYKPCGFVSYGGASGGMRAAQQAKLTVTAAKMMPLAEAVAIPFAAKLIDESKHFNSNEQLDSAAKVMLDELTKWGRALRTIRVP